MLACPPADRHLLVHLESELVGAMAPGRVSRAIHTISHKWEGNRHLHAYSSFLLLVTDCYADWRGGCRTCLNLLLHPVPPFDPYFVEGDPFAETLDEFFGPADEPLPSPGLQVACWRDGLLEKLARRVIHHNELDLVPILADAVEESDCCPWILAHLRGQAWHGRGCLALRHLLMKTSGAASSS
jgi:hypothetical protein